MKILYGLASEGMGHALRSKPIIDHLRKNNEVLVVCDGKVYNFMDNYFETVKIPSFRILHSDSEVKIFNTFFYNLFKLPVDLIRSLKFIGLMTKFKPDLVITDFEPYSNYYGKLFRKKIISLNNQEIATLTKIDMHGKKLSRLINTIIIKLFVPFSNKNIITTFFYPSVKDKNKTVLVEPILRKEIIESKISDKKHILVYIKNEKMIPILKSLKEKFIFYGLNEDKVDGNISFKKFSEKEFLRDLSSSSAVISAGGFTTISEALYLGKPIYTIPIKNHFEQYLNSYYIEKLGYGIRAKKIDMQEIADFISQKEKYRLKLKPYKEKYKNNFFSKLDKIISQLSS